MKLNDFKEIENYQKEREKKELDFILNLTQESFEDKEKEKEWNKLRTSFALYTEGRIKDTYMTRPRFFESKIDIEDFEYLLDVVQKYCDGRLHLTTRQDFQLHGMKKENLPKILEIISKRGFFTKATCGDSTRAVITPETTGFEEEVFDVSPHARIVTDYILNGREFMHLPRKYKIAFSNKEENSLYVKINDIGFQAVIQDGKKGFRVYVGGGIGPISTNSIVLREFIEEDEFLYYIHAIRNVFNEHGNRKIRARARLRYILLNLGEKKFLELCNEYISNFYAEKGDSLKIYTRKLLEEREILDREKELEKIKIFSSEENTDESIKNDEFLKNEKNIVAGKYKGEYGYYLRPARGNIYKEDGEKLIEFVKNLDYKVELKLTSFQSILVRGLKKEDVLKLKEIMSEYYGGNEFYSSYSCIGSTTCNVGILDTPPILDYIFEFFDNDKKRELTNYLPQIKVTGCPNSCATPQIARLGFSGRRKKDGEYFAIFARGEFSGKTVKLNENLGEIKANKIPYFLEDIANIIKKENTEFEKFANEDRFLGLIEDYKEIEVKNVDFNEFRKIDAEKAW